MIRRANSRSPEDNDVLRLIARAFRAKRQRKGSKRPIKIESRSEVTISLEDGHVTASNELALALDQIEPASKIHLIRECPVCSPIFWAGRSDAEACPEHSATWRKRKHRRKRTAQVAERAKQRAKRKEKQTEESLKLSRTTAAILYAIDEQCRTWKSIDDHVYSSLRKKRRKYRESPPGIYRTATVKRSLKMLVERGYLTYTGANDYYAPTEKLKRYERELAEAWATLEQSVVVRRYYLFDPGPPHYLPATH